MITKSAGIRVFIHASRPFKIPLATITTVVIIKRECQNNKAAGLAKNLSNSELTAWAEVSWKPPKTIHGT